ncbi:MAG TPA: hypothetical protein VGF55_12240 [Gemmataceae bacterium]|jgi:hypothetical protein
MAAFRRTLGGLAAVLGTVALLLSLAAGVGVWVVKAPVTARAVWVFGRVDTALVVAEQGLDHARASLDRAAERLDAVKAQQRALAQGPRSNGGMGRVLGRTVLQRIAPDIGDAHETLHTVAEAAVVVNSVLEDVGSFPLLSASGLDISDLTEMNSRLADVGPAAWELSRLLGEPAQEPDPTAAGAQLSRIEQSVARMRETVADFQRQVAQVRRRADDVKSRTLGSITPVAIGVSLACAWIALSQVSVLSHARSWLRHSGCSDPPGAPCPRHAV